MDEFHNGKEVEEGEVKEETDPCLCHLRKHTKI